MNRWEGIGGLVRDPDYKISQHGTRWLRLSVAVNDAEYDPATRQQVVTTTYVTVLLFGHQAETLVETLRQGDEVYVLGKLDQTEQEGRDGKVDRKTRVRAHYVLPTRVRDHQAGRQQEEADDPWAG